MLPDAYVHFIAPDICDLTQKMSSRHKPISVYLDGVPAVAELYHLLVSFTYLCAWG
jgi:hypothetical protein